MTQLGDSLGVGGKGDVRGDPQISGWAVGGDENDQFPERVNVRAEEGLGEGDEFSFGQSVHFLAFTTKWKSRYVGKCNS